MWFPFLGLFLGLLLGTIFTFAVPVIYAKYLSIAVLAALDSLLGAWRSLLEKKFDSPILISGFFSNMLLAAGLAYLGDLLGLDLYLAAVVAFGLRIFSNLGFIRRQLIFRYRDRKTAKNNGEAPNPLPDDGDISIIEDAIRNTVESIALEDAGERQSTPEEKSSAPSPSENE